MISFMFSGFKRNTFLKGTLGKNAFMKQNETDVAFCKQGQRKFQIHSGDICKVTRHPEPSIFLPTANTHLFSRICLLTAQEQQVKETAGFSLKRCQPPSASALSLAGV